MALASRQTLLAIQLGKFGHRKLAVSQLRTAPSVTLDSLCLVKMDLSPLAKVVKASLASLSSMLPQRAHALSRFLTHFLMQSGLTLLDRTRQCLPFKFTAQRNQFMRNLLKIPPGLVVRSTMLCCLLDLILLPQLL